MQRAITNTRQASPRQGSILLLVLVVVAVLTLGAYTFSEMMVSEVEATSMFGRQAESRAFADSGVELVAYGDRIGVVGKRNEVFEGVYRRPSR